MNLMSAHNQWASRPADERFWNLNDLAEALRVQREKTHERTVPYKEVQAVPLGNEVCLQGNSNMPCRMSHWSFQQLATRVKAPADYLRSLPVELAVANMNHGLRRLGDDGASLLLHQNGSWLVRAVTTPGYGRIWDEDVVKFLRPALDAGWMTPPARPAVDDPRARKATEADILPDQGNFGLSVRVGDMIAPAGVYRGDRDMFIFLVNPSRIVDDGGNGLMRGVFVWNSEVGAGAFRARTFFLENVCGNHICWGASGVKDLRIIHRKGSIQGYGGRLVMQLKAYDDSSISEASLMVKAAREYELGANRGEVIEGLFNKKSLGLSKRDLEGAWDTAVEWEHTARSAPTTAWGFVHGLTRYSQQQPYADARNRLDRTGGQILQMAAGGRAY